LQHRAPSTPVAIVKQVTRPDEHIKITTLGEFNPEDVDMFSLVMIGNSQTYQFKNHLITPRGYLNRKPQSGVEIQEESFRIVTNHIKDLPESIHNKWAMTRMIHTTGVLEDHQYYKATQNSIESIHNYLVNGGIVITDVTMVQAGITKAFIEKFNNQVVCLLNDKDVYELSEKENLTRSQAGFRKAISLFPNALYVVGNAPTALFEVTEQLRNNPEFKPVAIIGAPVGFVNVIESKEQLSQVTATDWVLVEGNRGGSNVAAAFVNAAYTLNDASKYFMN
ncbi:MAG: precorrin-8X methylmutase, partial [Lutibacter sp.]|nr:precorrin-8X methylmutase [Lutibacter sp.]